MFITNNLNPAEMLAELFRGVRAKPESTELFSKLRHDKHLLPHVRNKIAIMLDVYRAYDTEVHDIQSMRDDGVDIFFKYRDVNGNERRAGLQIKSDLEFCQWEDKKLQLLQVLKSQYAAAMENVRLDEYYVLLCVDSVRHQSRIRMLCAELKNFSSLKVIEPEDLFDFYCMGQTEIWARVTKLLCHNDSVLKKALEEVGNESPDTAFFIVDLICRAFGSSYKIDGDYLNQLWSEWVELSGTADNGEGRVSEILYNLVGQNIIEDNDGEYTIQPNDLPGGLCALYYDIRVRSSGSKEFIRDELLSLLEIL